MLGILFVTDTKVLNKMMVSMNRVPHTVPKVGMVDCSSLQLYIYRKKYSNRHNYDHFQLYFHTSQFIAGPIHWDLQAIVESL